MINLRNAIVAGLALALAAGCASTDTQAPAPVEEGKSGAPGAAGAPGATTSGTGTAGIGGTPTAPGGARVPPKENVVLARRTVYFDYDSFVVKDEYRATVDAHSKFMQANKVARVTLQGHTDERGSREYNIALGQKRADSVKQLMQLLGGTDVQIETVSFGEEKPKAEGHDEAAWSQNRRVEIIYVGE
jgi:peptidoglycan-associated lipoprotein